jgi:hypothetical protein
MPSKLHTLISEFRALRKEILHRDGTLYRLTYLNLRAIVYVYR